MGCCALDRGTAVALRLLEAQVLRAVADARPVRGTRRRGGPCAERLGR
jgi:hypothetical protein